MLNNLNTPILILSAVVVSFFVALWLSLIIWTARDIKSRSRDPFLRILSVSAVIVLNLIGFVVYLILRPKYTILELFQQSLEEEALLQSIEGTSRCPGCGKSTEKEWLYCPFCETELKYHCQTCSHILHMDWKICPLCSTPVKIQEENAEKKNHESSFSLIDQEESTSDTKETNTEELIEDSNIDQL